MNLAFVLLPESRPPEGEEIVRAFSSFPDEGESLHLKAAKAAEQTTAEVLEFEFGSSGTAFVALMPVAVPKGEADAAAQFSVFSLSTGWKLPSHTAHLVVTLRDVDSRSVSETLSRFTSFVAAVTKASGAVGVYWGNAGATHDAKFFIVTAQDREPVERLMLWTGVSVAREADGRLSLLSLGMKQLNLPDLLLIAPKSAGNDALATFFDLLAYVTSRGKPLPDGDTIGRTAEERMPVRYVHSPIDPSKRVWRVEVK